MFPAGGITCWDGWKHPAVGSVEPTWGWGHMGNGSQGHRQETRECHIRVLSNSQNSEENRIVPIDKAPRKEGPTRGTE